MSTISCRNAALRVWPMVSALLALAAVVLLGSAHPAAAQPCTADSQCRFGIGRAAACVGNTLIVKERRCFSGYCRDLEVRRQDCGPPPGGRCVGGNYETVGSRCDPLLGQCASRTERLPCTPSCTCRNKVLTVVTGECSPAIGCHRGVRKCPGGCTCKPEPRCLDAKN